MCLFLLNFVASPSFELTSKSQLAWQRYNWLEKLASKLRMKISSHVIHYSDIIISAMACQITGFLACQITGCLFNCLFRRRIKKTSKLHVTGLCERNPPVTDVFPSQRSSNGKHVSIWWRHHAEIVPCSIGQWWQGMIRKLFPSQAHSMRILPSLADSRHKGLVT